jgi:hypothetical protein
MARNDEISLINTLIQFGESKGVIGIEAGRKLQRLPSNIYWAGLGRLGIRKFTGSQAQYHRWLDTFYRQKEVIFAGETREPLHGNVQTNWDLALPKMPKNLIGETGLSLSRVEAEYLKDKIGLSCKGTLFAFLIQQNSNLGQNQTFIWDHPKKNAFPLNLRTLVEHGQCFSMIMHGASILYNLMLAECVRQRELMEEHETRFQDWVDSITTHRNLLEKWSLKDFWEITTNQRKRISFLTQNFVSSWKNRVLETDTLSNLVGDLAARDLIKDREYRLKRARSRLINPRHLDLWTGASGLLQLDFRWSNARTIINDVLTGLEQGN